MYIIIIIIIMIMMMMIIIIIIIICGHIALVGEEESLQEIIFLVTTI